MSEATSESFVVAIRMAGFGKHKNQFRTRYLLSFGVGHRDQWSITHYKSRAIRFPSYDAAMAAASGLMHEHGKDSVKVIESTLKRKVNTRSRSSLGFWLAEHTELGVVKHCWIFECPKRAMINEVWDACWAKAAILDIAVRQPISTWDKPIATWHVNLTQILKHRFAGCDDCYVFPGSDK